MKITEAEIEKVMELSTLACDDLLNIKALLDALIILCETQTTDCTLLGLSLNMRKKVFNKIQRCKRLVGIGENYEL